MVENNKFNNPSKDIREVLNKINKIQTKSLLKEKNIPVFGRKKVELSQERLTPELYKIFHEYVKMLEKIGEAKKDEIIFYLARKNNINPSALKGELIKWNIYSKTLQQLKKEGLPKSKELSDAVDEYRGWIYMSGGKKREEGIKYLVDKYNLPEDLFIEELKRLGIY